MPKCGGSGRGCSIAATATTSWPTRVASSVAAKLEPHLAPGAPWLLGGDYSLADIKWYSMVPGLPRLVPEICNREATPAIVGWLERMAARPAVMALEQYRPAPAGNPT